MQFYFSYIILIPAVLTVIEFFEFFSNEHILVTTLNLCNCLRIRLLKIKNNRLKKIKIYNILRKIAIKKYRPIKSQFYLVI